MANIRDLIFYIPFSYTLSTRVKTVGGCIRLFSKYVLPVVFIAFCRNGFSYRFAFDGCRSSVCL